MNTLRSVRVFFACWVAFTLLAQSAACNAPVQTPDRGPVPPETTAPSHEGLATPTATRTPTSTITPRPTFTQVITPAPTATLELVTVLTSFDQLPALPFGLQYRVGSSVYYLEKDSKTPQLFRDLAAWQEGDFLKLEWRGDRLFRTNGYQEGQLDRSVPIEWQMIDLETNTIQPVIQFIPDNENPYGFSPMSFSPDGRWVVYCKTQLSTDPPSSELYLVSVDHPENARVLSGCHSNWTITWSPGGDHLVWDYDQSIWTASVNSAAHKILPGEAYQSPAYEDRGTAWSTSSRYIIIDALGTIEGGIKIILDLATGKTGAVPNTWRYVNAAAWIGWIQNDRLLSLKPSGMSFTADGAMDPFEITIWKVNPMLDGLLEQEAVYKIEGLQQYSWPLEGRMTEDGRILFAVLPPEVDPSQNNEDWQGGIYQYDPQQSSLQLIQPLPKNLSFHSISSCTWAPDYSAALMNFSSSNGWGIFYLPLDGEHFYDARPIFGPDATSFTWLP